MIGFAAPWVLAGLAAAAVPLLLHLFARREPPALPFPATRYLAETTRAHHRRLTLQHWLLLLVRTLLIALLVIAAAGPSAAGGGAAAHAPAAIALVVDNSLSSAATAGGTPVLDRLRTAARAIAAASHGDDALWLVTADAFPRRVSREELVSLLDAMRPADRRLDLGQAIAAAGDVLAAQPLPGTVVVLSDLQATALSAAPRLPSLVVVRPEGEPVPNVGVSAVDPGRQPWGREGGRITVGTGGTAGKTAALSVAVGSRPPRRQLTTAGGTFSASSGPLPAGWWTVRADLEPDELREDNARISVTRVADAARASWRPDDRFLAAAAEVLVQNGRLVRGSDLSLGDLGPRQAIVQPPADPARLGALNRELAGRGIAWRFGDLVGGSTVTDSGPLLGRHQVSRRYALVPAGAQGAGAPRGVLLTAGGSPWAVRSGTTILLGSRLEPAWTDLPLSAEFVPFVDYLANRAVRGEVVLLDGAPGDPVLLPDAATAVAKDGRAREVEGGGPFRPGERGIYFVLAGRDTIGALAVNADPRESEPARAGDATVRNLWPGAQVVAPARAAGAAFAARGRTDLRGPFLLAAALLALADAALAGAGGRRAARPA